MEFKPTLATIVEEDDVDIYHEILCEDDEDDYNEITFQVCLAIGMIM
jgi:hypothetical protein